MNYLAKTKKHFLELAEKPNNKYSYLNRHITSVEKVALKVLKIYPDADKEVVLLGVWLHDIGILVNGLDTDHAVTGEVETKRFLKEIGANNNLIEKVSHCVRAHRNRDISPRTLEAKIVAVSDSASHMLEPVYVDIACRGELEEGVSKLERDYRDIKLLPEVQTQMQPLYLAWKHLLEIYPK